ncbi:MAG: hypothetical protein R6U44_08540 [Archaeoglobaceae archaeon]
MISESDKVMTYKDGWEDEELEGAIIIGLPGEEEEPEEEFPSGE